MDINSKSKDEKIVSICAWILFHGHKKKPKGEPINRLDYEKMLLRLFAATVVCNHSPIFKSAEECHHFINQLHAAVYQLFYKDNSIAVQNLNDAINQRFPLYFDLISESPKTNDKIMGLEIEGQTFQVFENQIVKFDRAVQSFVGMVEPQESTEQRVKENPLASFYCYFLLGHRDVQNIINPEA